jgi:L-asparaginase
MAGAIRPASGLSTDADINLLDAARVAAAAESRGKGVLVVLNQTIHSARDVTKGSTLRLDAFVSRDTGPLGYIDGFGIAYYRALARPPSPPFSIADRSLPRVDIALSYVGSDGTAIKAFVDAGASGIVLACSAFDGRSQAEDERIGEAIARGVAVVLASRTGSGRVVLSEASRRRGLIGAADLLPWKARILLALALQNTHDPSEIQQSFDRA